MNEAEILALLQGRMHSLVTRLHELSPESHLLLGTVLPYANGLLNEQATGATAEQRRAWAKQDGVSPAQEAGVNHFVIVFNRWLAGSFVPEMQDAGVPITLVDQYRNFILEDGSVRGWGPEAPDGFGDFGLHPNPYGYDLMGETWARAIEKVLKEDR
jgi:lysophospholipase L1-like esterase